MSITTRSARDLLVRARRSLILDAAPFWGALALRLKLEQAQGAGIETTTTDGERLVFSPEFVERLTHDERVAVLAHEVLHAANGHQFRRGDRDAALWNVATDYAINPILLEAGFRLPADHLVDDRFKGLGAEEIYDMLRQQGDESGAGGSGEGDAGQGGSGEQLADEDKGGGGGADKPGPLDPGGCGAVMDCTGDAEQAEAEWKAAVVQAARMSRGSLPGGLKRLVDELVSPPVPWQTLLRDFVTRTARNDYDWMRPNRKWFGRGVVLPSLVSDELPQVVVANDTSGSISDRQMQEFAGAISDILGSFDTTATVLHCDTAVRKVEELTRADLPLRLEPIGGGGTDFRPVFDHVEEHGLEPACLIYLTDLYGCFPQRPPDYPVLWVVNRDSCAGPPPFGEVIRY